MARGLCFQTLCAVIAVLVVAPVRSDEVDDFLNHERQQGRLPSKGLFDVQRSILTIYVQIMRLHMNHTMQNFETKTKEIKANVQNLTAVTWENFRLQLGNLRRVQQLLTYSMAYNLTRTKSLREELDKMPDSKNLFQAAFPVRLVDGINGSHEGRLEMEVGNTVGTICNHEASMTIIGVVCRQLGLSWSTSGLKYGLHGYGWTFRNKKHEGSILLDTVSCRGHENHLLLCPSHLLFHYHRYCSNHNLDVGIHCN